ncbi:MAG: transcription antitermination factor NusB [Verrucomicrobiota bacterium]|nr:transcription antitermination factor NusB [Verrucomicrobiota bacterium]
MQNLHPRIKRKTLIQCLVAIDTLKADIIEFEKILPYLPRTMEEDFPQCKKFLIKRQEEIKKILEIILNNQEELDKKIADSAKNWRIERMAIVDRNILRLALYELMYTEVPPPVIMDEALELSKIFSEEQSYKFINGVLDKIKNNLEKEKME